MLGVLGYGEVHRVARDAEHCDGAVDRINAGDDEGVGVKGGAVATLINANEEHIQTLLPIPAWCRCSARSLGARREDAADKLRCGGNVSAKDQMQGERGNEREGKSGK